MTITRPSGVRSRLAAELRRGRLDAGLEQDEMAERIGVARNTVSNWERGRSEPTATMFVRWARVTGQPLEWLADLLPDLDSNQEPAGSRRAQFGLVA